MSYICTPNKVKRKIMMNDIIKFVDSQNARNTDMPAFKAGDTITVHYKIIEGTKEIIQLFQGVVIQRAGTSAGATFTVRKMSNGVGVERIFPSGSPFIDKIEVNKVGVVRRAKLFYLRELTGKSARIRERISSGSEEAAATEA